MNRDAVIRHYDLLVDEGNDPFFDPPRLQRYMDRWDGPSFLKALSLDRTKTVLEIGIGTGRIAVRVIPCCGHFTRIDISPKSICRAAENLSVFRNLSLICGDFLEYPFSECFDVIDSSLTFMHIRPKRAAIDKISRLLNPGGVFVLSIDKDQSRYLEYNDRRIQIFPDSPEEIERFAVNAGLALKQQSETKFAHILVFERPGDLP